MKNKCPSCHEGFEAIEKVNGIWKWIPCKKCQEQGGEFEWIEENKYKELGFYFAKYEYK